MELLSALIIHIADTSAEGLVSVSMACHSLVDLNVHVVCHRHDDQPFCRNIGDMNNSDGRQLRQSPSGLH